MRDYLLAVKQWVAFENNGVPREKALTVIKKFYFENTYTRLKNNSEKDSLLDEFLIECDDCQKCKYKDNCCYDNVRKIIADTGKEYSEFTNGQAKENFVFKK